MVFIEGFETGWADRHGRVTYWPLYSPDIEVDFVGQVRLVEDVGYDRLKLRGNGNRPVIAPWGMTFVIPGAQDRALREPVFIPANRKMYASAVCIEPGQCGLWHGQEVEVGQLPPSLLAALPSDGGYDALWKSIKDRYACQGRRGDTVAGLLEGKLSHDVSMDNQRGVIVALDGRPVALYVAPSVSAYADWWHSGLGRSLAFETTFPPLPLPIGSMSNEPLVFEDGLHQVTAWQVLVGWACVVSGKLAYATLVDSEALSAFKKREPRMEEWEA